MEALKRSMVRRLPEFRARRVIKHGIGRAPCEGEDFFPGMPLSGYPVQPLAANEKGRPLVPKAMWALR